MGEEWFGDARPAQGSAPGDLVGRNAELARVSTLIGDDRPVLVVGEAGIGKTSLVRAAAAMASRRVREGGAFATLRDSRYLALRRAIAEDLRGDALDVARIVERRVGPDLLFVDDVQWADPATAEVVPLLAGRVALALAVRDGDASAQPALDMARAISAEPVHLRGLDDDAAHRLLKRIAPTMPTTERRSIIKRAGGNALLLEELGSRGAASRSLARSIVARLDGVSGPARDAVRLLAVAGHPLEAATLGEEAPELVRSGLVVETIEGLSVRHALVADAVLAEIEPDELPNIHATISQLVRDPLLRARHCSLGGRMAESRAIALAALGSETDLHRIAVLRETAASASDGIESARLRVDAARAWLGAGDYEAARDVLLRVGDVSADLAGLRQAFLAQAEFHLGRWDEADEALRLGLALPLDPHGEASYEVITEAAIRHANGGAMREAIGLLESAETRVAGRKAGDALQSTPVRGESQPDEPTPWMVRRRALLAYVLFLSGEQTDVAVIRDGIEQAALDGQRARSYQMARNLHGLLLVSDGPGAVLAFEADESSRLAGLGLAAGAAFFRGERVQTLTFLGRPRDAVSEADVLLEEPLPPKTRLWVRTKRAEALTILGRFDEAQATLEAVEPELTTDFEGLGEARIAAANLAYWSGQPGRAIQLAEGALGVPSHFGGNYLLPALTRAWAQHDLGHTPAGLPEAPNFWLRTAANLEVRGIRLLAAGDPDAGSVFGEAALAWHGHHVPRELVCRWASAEAGRKRSAERAIEELEAVLAQASDIGFGPLAGRVRRSMRLAGARRMATDTIAGRPPGAQLTPRERQILELVGRGLNNMEIARRVSLGRPTVARMLSNAMLKLGADSRAQAVAILEAEAR